MKGFLQRVAVNAIRPMPRTHPLVESIYATGPAADMAAPSLQFESTVRPASTEPRIRESSGYRLPEDRAQSDGMPTLLHTTNRSPNPAHRAVQDRFEPLVQSSNASFSMGPVPEERRISEEITEAQPNAGAGSSPESDAARLSSGIRARVWGDLPDVVERLLESKAADADEAAIVRQAAETLPAQLRRGASEIQAGAAQVNPRRQAFQPSPAPEAQPEEIQIHIGRIEVLAVPQAASRPAAAPVRKGLNLDEYLSRRNGRRG